MGVKSPEEEVKGNCVTGLMLTFRCRYESVRAAVRIFAIMCIIKGQLAKLQLECCSCLQYLINLLM